MRTLAKLLSSKGIYYGWVIVAVGFTAGFTKAGLTGTLFNVFLKPISDDFGWTRGMTAGAVTVGTIVAGLTSLSIGRVVDRHGIRLVLGLGGLVMGATYLGLSFINALWNFYLIFALGRALALSAVSDTMTSTAIANWFIRKRASAMAVVLTGTGAGGLVLSPLMQAVIDTYGWRLAWLILGVLTRAVLVLPSVLLVGRRPEDAGLTLEHEGFGRGHSSQRTAYVERGELTAVWERSWTLREASHTTAFLLLNIAIPIGSLANAAVGFHLVAFLTDEGVSTSAAATTFGFFAAAGVLANFGWGWLADKLHVRYCTILALVGSGLGVIVLTTTAREGMVFASMIVYGLFSGGFWMLCHLIWAVYFGREHLGAIRGVAVFLQMIGLSLGPLFGALVFDVIGSYHYAFYGAVVVSLLASLLVFAARPPEGTKHGSFR